MTVAPWPPAAATGIGSMPGTDVAEALRTVLGELPDLPHLPELPARGPGADLVGRGAGLLVEMPVDLQPSGWRLVDRPGRDASRTHGLLARDLDTLAELADGYRGVLKVQACGPWTLAAAVELHHGDKALADHGAVRDLAASLAAGLAAHVADVRRAVPGASLVVQLDEPSLPAVLAGKVRTASGFGTLRRPEATTAGSVLALVLDAVRDAASTVVHCCAPDVPFGLLRGAGAGAVSADLTVLDLTDTTVLDLLGEHLDAGSGLGAGVVPATGGELSDARVSVSIVRTLWRRLGLDPGRLAGQVAVSPTCGLAGASPARARAVLRLCRESGVRLVEAPEG